ncbi:MAG: AAA family ATPase [Phycisphaeraceae bacterium]|nr:AAA family ATPase [Phycisphaeraceae bacterium]
MRAIVTGQVGMDKKDYLNKVARLAGERGESIEVFHVGDMMYDEARDVRPGRILDLPLSRLNSLRRAAFKDILTQSEGKRNLLVNTHATFRWRHGLFSAFDFDQVRKLAPDMLICLVDNIEVVHNRLHGEHTLDATLKDLMVWREEEIMATELMAQAVSSVSGRRNFYVLSRGRHQDTIETCYRLICKPQMRKVYPSFPMSHVVDMPEVLAEIDRFRASLAKHFICFDPGDVDEKLLLDAAIAAAKEGRDFVEMKPGSFTGSAGQSLRVSVKQVLDIAGDVDGQIYARDFKLVDQSDMIVSLVPELPGGVPGLSSGVERELHHAFEHGKEVYVVWKPKKNPSPFITETATKVFKSVEEALTYFENTGMFAQVNLFGH